MMYETTGFTKFKTKKEKISKCVTEIITQANYYKSLSVRFL